MHELSQRRTTNTHKDIPIVSGNCELLLNNPDGGDSVTDLKPCDNAYDPALTLKRYFDLGMLDGIKIHSSAKAKDGSLFGSAKTLLVQRSMRLLPTHCVWGLRRIKTR